MNVNKYTEWASLIERTTTATTTPETMKKKKKQQPQQHTKPVSITFRYVYNYRVWLGTHNTFWYWPLMALCIRVLRLILDTHTLAHTVSRCIQRQTFFFVNFWHFAILNTRSPAFYLLISVWVRCSSICQSTQNQRKTKSIRISFAIFGAIIQCGRFWSTFWMHLGDLRQTRLREKKLKLKQVAWKYAQTNESIRLNA